MLAFIFSSYHPGVLGVFSRRKICILLTTTSSKAIAAFSQKIMSDDKATKNERQAFQASHHNVIKGRIVIMLCMLRFKPL